MRRPFLTNDCALSAASSNDMYQLITRHRKIVQLVCIPKQLTLLDHLLGKSSISSFVYFLN
jgi:hypothetical protein